MLLSRFPATSNILIKMDLSRPLFRFIFVFLTVNSEHVLYKTLPKMVFEQWTSSIWSNCSATWATITSIILWMSNYSIILWMSNYYISFPFELFLRNSFSIVLRLFLIILQLAWYVPTQLYPFCRYLIVWFCMNYIKKSCPFVVASLKFSFFDDFFSSSKMFSILTHFFLKALEHLSHPQWE